MKEPKEQNVIVEDESGNKFKVQFDYCVRCESFRDCYNLDNEDETQRYPHYISSECGDDIDD